MLFYLQEVHTALAPKRPLQIPEGVQPDCRPGPMVHSSNTPHTIRASHHTFFSPRGSEQSPLILPLLSGDIETITGPSYPCPTCSRPNKKRGGSIQCHQCSSWTHYNIRCCGVPQRHHILPGWVCYKFHPYIT